MSDKIVTIEACQTKTRRSTVLWRATNELQWPSNVVKREALCPICEVGDLEGFRVRKTLKRVAPRVGLEPTTQRLTAACSTN